MTTFYVDPTKWEIWGWEIYNPKEPIGWDQDRGAIPQELVWEACLGPVIAMDDEQPLKFLIFSEGRARWVTQRVQGQFGAETPESLPVAFRDYSSYDHRTGENLAADMLAYYELRRAG